MRYPQPIWITTKPAKQSLQRAIDCRYPVRVDNEILDSHGLDGDAEYVLADGTDSDHIHLANASSGDVVRITGYLSISVTDDAVLIDRYEPAEREMRQYEEYQQQRERMPNERRRGHHPDQYRANVIRHVRTWRIANGRWPTEEEWEATHGTGNSGQTRLRRNQRAILARWDTWDALIGHVRQLEEDGVPIEPGNRNLLSRLPNQ